MKIRRRCKCGCGGIANPNKRYIRGHNRRGKKHSEKTKKKMSSAQMGNTNTLGKELSKEHILKMSLSKIKHNPNYKYCEIWKDKEYVRDLRKEYCENANCKSNSKKLNNHHIYLNKKKCTPNDIMTLCNSCHTILHNALREDRNKPANSEDYIIINRPDHLSYINKNSKEVIKIKKVMFC